MARPLRIEFPGAVYHVTSRGNDRAPIYVDDDDRRAFLNCLGETVTRFQWLCHAYCLMDNHFHLMIETPEGNLSAGMRQLNGVYTQRFNRRHNRGGHLFQGRFKSILIDKNGYLLELCRYVVLNPVRVGIVVGPEHYLWSSYGATLGLWDPPDWQTTEWILAQFGMWRGRAKRKYRGFVRAGINASSPWASLRHQVLLGDETFLERLRPKLTDLAAIKEIPREQRFAGRPTLDTLFAEREGWTKAERDERFRNAHLECGYKLVEIADASGMHYSTVSKAINRR